MNQKTAIIIGAGPAGLTAAYELLDKTDIKPIIFEKSSDIGGISKTVNYKGNRIDIGGHRFFSKSEIVMNWWEHILPIQGKPSIDDIILNRTVILSKKKNAPDPEKTNFVMLVRNRLSRIFFLQSFFDYPISFRWDTFKNLGVKKIIKIALSYIKARIFPIKDQRSLEDFFINRFGKELYLLFFKDYTEKLWGVPCSEIKSEWGNQRIKGLSISKAIVHAVKFFFHKDISIDQKKTETSLIEQFLYPKLGPGQLWEKVARLIEAKGGEIHFESTIVGINVFKGRVLGSNVKNNITNIISEYKCDFIISTMPVKELIQSIIPAPPEIVQKVAKGLLYRDFITVGVLLKKMKIFNETAIPTINQIVPDNWIYIQDKDITLGRLQIFNNWSPYMVKDPNTVWIGLEYFCNEGDEIWSKSDDEFIKFAINELSQINIINKEDVLDSTIIRILKAYPAYFGAYDDFHIIRDFTDKIENLFLIGRNGMHKYNNTDHSMLTAITAVENIIRDNTLKENIWSVNTDNEYHEEGS